MIDLAAARDAALSILDETDELALRHFSSGVDAQTKDDGSPVTAADTGVERILRERLAERFGAHAVLGEEEGGGLDPTTPTWVVDPIDATKNFLRGVPVWATLVALVLDGAPVLGVVSAPAMGERWEATSGGGCHRNGERMTVSGVASLQQAHVIHGGLSWFRRSERHWRLLGEVVDRSWRTRGFGDFWMHLLVAAGQADVAFERDVKPWDIAAPEVLVTEAGGRFTAWDGSPALLSGEALATNAGVLHDEMVALLGGDTAASAGA